MTLSNMYSRAGKWNECCKNKDDDGSLTIVEAIGAQLGWYWKLPRDKDNIVKSIF